MGAEKSDGSGVLENALDVCATAATAWTFCCVEDEEDNEEEEDEDVDGRFELKPLGGGKIGGVGFIKTVVVDELVPGVACN